MTAAEQDCPGALEQYECALGRYRSELPSPSDKSVQQLQSAEVRLRRAMAARYGEQAAPIAELPPAVLLNGAWKMTALLRLAGIACALLGLGACGLPGHSDDGISRSLTIADGRLRPARLSSPAGTPITLAVAMAGTGHAFISSADLHVAAVSVPQNCHASSPVHNSGPGHSNKLHLKIGPLPPGSYEIVCEFADHSDSAVLTVGE